MKKTALLLWILSYLPLYALPLGNPAEPSLFPIYCYSGCSWDYFNVGLGYYGDFVFNRRMATSIPSTMPKTEITTQAGYLVANAFDTIDLFTSLGVSKITLLGRGKDFGGGSVQAGVPPPRGVTLESTSHFSWSLGARATLWQCSCFGLGVEGQYSHTTPNINFIADNLDSLAFPDHIPMKYREWQVGVGGFYRIECDPCYCYLSSAIPYAGLKWSKAHLNLSNGFITIPSSFDIDSYHLPNLRSRRHLGFALGTTLLFCNQLGLTVEARFRDELALYVNGQLRF